MTNMSLNNTSRPGGPGPDELVPSRYALRVGEIDVLVISDGVFPLQAATLATNADPADLAAWLDYRLQPPDVFQWPLNVVVVRSGGQTRGHSVVRLASGGDRLTFLGDAVFPNHFDHPDWHNAFDHDPEEAVRVRVSLLRELAETGEPLVAAHLPFPSVGRVAVAGNVFRFVPAVWEY